MARAKRSKPGFAVALRRARRRHSRGYLLLSHAHEVNNAKSAFLMEVSHLPMGLVVLVAGWSRWLELRLPPVDGRKAGRFWGPGLVALGLLLLLYREQ